MKTKLLKVLEEAKDYYAWKSIDFEEKNQDEKSQKMSEIYDEIEKLEDYLDNNL